MSGEIAAVGRQVVGWKVGSRVTAPFVNGCGTCPECRSGNAQVCADQRQPGFTHWGCFAEYVVVEPAMPNLVSIPDGIDYATAASLGCRFATAFRGVLAQGGLKPGQWIAVHGCGGVGLSAIMIAHATGARAIGIDIQPAALELARLGGAEFTLNPVECPDIAEAVRDFTGGGVEVSIDALGNPATCRSSVECLRRRGTHVQLGLLLKDQRCPPLPMDRVIAYELRIVGSHGMSAHEYPDLLGMIQAGRLHPERLIQRRVSLDEGAALLSRMDEFSSAGITIIDHFE
jgi:alcohol dehydrogenase